MSVEIVQLAVAMVDVGLWCLVVFTIARKRDVGL